MKKQHVDNGFRKVLKATSLFGGVQVVNILISLARSKFVAVLIGPSGMGILGLLNSTLYLVNSGTQLGLDKSAVKELSYAKKNEGEEAVSRQAAILKRLVWGTIVIGMLIMIIGAPWFSQWAFDADTFTTPIRWLALAVLFTQLTKSRLAILQGLQKHAPLAKANVLGNFIALALTIPLYYFYGIDAIVPVIIIASAISLIVTLYFSERISLPKTRVSNAVALQEGKGMIGLGVTLSVSGLIALLTTYLLQIFISYQSGTAEVGFYNAGIVILNTYVGMVFTAMATDYFPRLSALSDDILRIRQTVFEQAYIAVLLLVPIVVVFTAFAPFIINVLYSDAFDPTATFVRWGILAMLLRAVSWSMGYIIIAKGDSRLFIKTAIGFNALLLGLNLLGYYYWGFVGLGISFIVHYSLHAVGMFLITRWRYQFYFPSGFSGIFFGSVVLCVVAFLVSFVENTFWRYFAHVLLILIASGYSIYFLDRKIKLRTWIRSYLGRNK
ncbi:oligosaccharide flippase family protein [Altibacter sp. HG106]|uniref:oligosaccharide flippase family protein n=1 Tax=Altibacter sp. HG106 TaxID=3023937 RepID=UPI00234FD484|nr:oligosaccharide flippase family protein [Altibacter sp. HG106]MDC7996133.1 oligosaccharide flippase family protein [Altibacter sp. HG106]